MFKMSAFSSDACRESKLRTDLWIVSSGRSFQIAAQPLSDPLHSAV